MGQVSATVNQFGASCL